MGFRNYLSTTAAISVASLVLFACGLDIETSITAQRAAAQSAPSILAVYPLDAKPNEQVHVEGKKLPIDSAVKIRLQLADDSIRDLAMTVRNSQSASFLMPEGGELGILSVGIVRDSNILTSYAVKAEHVTAVNFTPQSGSYRTGQSVSLSSSTEGAVIFYTLDGSNPSMSS